jgi:hypothetical protein
MLSCAVLSTAALLLALAASDVPATGCASFDLSLAGIGSLEEDLARTAGLAGSGPIWPGLLRRPSGARPLLLCPDGAPLREEVPDPAPAAHLSFELVPPASLTRVLSGWADDRNDGALWAGRGLSTSLTAGVRARWKWFSAQFAPLAAWQMNHTFYVPPASFPGLSPWANPFNYGSIDLPLRMGPSDFWTFSPGQTYLRADAWGLAVGLSSENLWWGPGIRNSILMSNSAAGFPHLFLGTSRPIDIWIGWLEAEVMWGRLAESRWFDADPGNDRRHFQSVVYTFTPAIGRNFTFGLARAWVYPDTNVGWSEYVKPIMPPFLRITSPGGQENTRENQLLSLFARWVLPEVQLELYGEWGRDDFALNTSHLLQDPWYASAYLGGLQKLFPLREGWLRLQVEATHTYEVRAASGTNTPIFYTHGTDHHGYTNGGQMIGAGLGPQGDTQFLGLDWYLRAGRIGFFVERTLRHERFWNDAVFPATNDYVTHDLEMSVGTRGAWAFLEWDLGWEVAAAYRYHLNLGPPEGGVDATFHVTWWPGRAQAPVLPPPAARRERETAR